MQQLPAKDQAVFRSIVKFYETKQYKKGVKAADSILKKHPEHGETLCMKGLTLSYLDKKEEAYELTRKGLKHDLRSHVCWHVYGLLYRQDRDYKEAVKCYRQALRIDPDNIQILRDLSLLQIHCRDVTGFAETRRKLLQVKPGHRLNWVGYAIAEHLCQSYEFAWTCIDNYEKTFKDDGDTPYENSELFMYKATIMEEAGKLEEALKCLTDHEKQIVDKLGMLEMKGRLCMFLERYSEAADIFQRLLKLNPENHNYVLALMANQERFHRFWPALPKPATGTGEGPLPSTINSFPQSVHPEGTPVFGWLPPKHAQGPRKRVAIGRRQHKQKLESYEPLAPLTGEEEAAVDEFFDELSKEHPRSDALKRLPLYFLSGLRLKKRLDMYLRSRMRKGVPSMFRMLRPLYFQEGKGAVIESLLMQYTRFLEAEVPSFGPAPSDKALPDVSEYKVSEEEEEAPSCLLFCRMVTAEHFDFYGETHKALEYIDKAIEHTPTMVEIYACKARIYRHAGDLEESAKWFDTVRQMDLADRFLNTQCVRALLRVDNTQGGMEKALLFSKEPDSPEAANLHDMQCMWYESAVGRSYCRQRKPGKALKQFGETIKHFSDIAEDQFDFHNYCLRKSTLKAYVAMLRMQERLYSHKFFRRAAKDSIKIYLELFDMRLRGEGTEKGGENGKDGEAEMSAAEKKKLKHAQKRQKAKEEEKKAVSTPSGKPKKVDDDPDGEKLLEKDPMEEANKLVKQLVLFCDAAPASHVLTYEVFCRQGRWLHCLQAILRLFALSNRDPTNYKLISPLAHFCFQAKLEDGAVPAVVREVILGELAPVVAGEGAQPFKSVADMRSAANKVVDSVEQRLQTDKELAVVEVMNGLKCLKNAGRDCGKILSQWSPQGAVSLKECKKLLEYLEKEFGKGSAELANFKKRCSEIFPLMVIR